MSTANKVPETWRLTGDDAKETLARVGRGALMRDAFLRLRWADGFSHARSMAYATTLIFVQGVIALVGLASVLGAGGARRSDRQHVAVGRAGTDRAGADRGGRPGTTGRLAHPRRADPGNARRRVHDRRS